MLYPTPADLQRFSWLVVAARVHARCLIPVVMPGPVLQDQTSIAVGVKAEIGVPDAVAPNRGRVEFFVDW